jgi:hypothetical protein
MSHSEVVTQSGAPFGSRNEAESLRLERFLAASHVFGPDARRPHWRSVQAESRSGSVAGADTLSTVTATLGRLYLDQGHLEEAGKIFERVLAANPADAGATEGLDLLGTARRALEEGVAEDPGRVSGRSKRRIQRLERFLRRVSRSSSKA